MKNSFGFPARLGHLSAVKFSQSSTVSTLPSLVHKYSLLLTSTPPWLMNTITKQSLSWWSRLLTVNRNLAARLVKYIWELGENMHIHSTCLKTWMSICFKEGRPAGPATWNGHTAPLDLWWWEFISYLCYVPCACSMLVCVKKSWCSKQSHWVVWNIQSIFLCNSFSGKNMLEMRVFHYMVWCA